MDRMVSEAICKQTRSEICHVDIVMPSGTLIGAHIRDGIQERPHDYEAWGLRIRVTLEVPQAKADALYSYARSMVGTKYDAADIVGIALGDARIHEDGRMICSQFAALASDEKSNIVRVRKDKWQVSPEELRLVWASQPGAIEERIAGRANRAAAS
jgi:hypothetical protein